MARSESQANLYQNTMYRKCGAKDIKVLDDTSLGTQQTVPSI